MNSSDPADPTLEPFIEAILARKAHRLVVLDVSELTSFADYFVICSGRSNRQVTAIAEHLKRSLKKQALTPISADGIREGQWALLDYGNVIIHVFYESMRDFYDLEGLWSDAVRIRTAAMEAYEAEALSGPVDEEYHIE
ncbi:MAG: ribosome silencing factor [Desulfosarcinaceae bacterium]|nr:ribosome silencing factor [Desulfosarcinaceae bacterium]